MAAGECRCWLQGPPSALLHPRHLVRERRSGWWRLGCGRGGGAGGGLPPVDRHRRALLLSPTFLGKTVWNLAKQEDSVLSTAGPHLRSSLRGKGKGSAGDSDTGETERMTAASLTLPDTSDQLIGYPVHVFRTTLNDKWAQQVFSSCGRRCFVWGAGSRRASDVCCIAFTPFL